MSEFHRPMTAGPWISASDFLVMTAAMHTVLCHIQEDSCDGPDCVGVGLAPVLQRYEVSGDRAEWDEWWAGGKHE